MLLSVLKASVAIKLLENKSSSISLARAPPEMNEGAIEKDSLKDRDSVIKESKDISYPVNDKKLDKKNQKE